MQASIYDKDWAKDKTMNNCPFCESMPVLNGAPVKMNPILGFLYSGQVMGDDWACPTCNSVFDKDNNLIVMGKLPVG